MSTRGGGLGKAHVKHRSEVEFRALIEDINEVVYLLDAQDVITYVSPAVCRFNLLPDDLIGKQFTRYIHPDDLPQIEGILDRKEPHKLEGVDLRLLTPDGSTFNVHCSIRPMYENGQYTGIRGVLFDRTASLQIEKGLERRAGQLSLLNRIGEGIASGLDFDQVVSFAVDQLQKSFGYYHVAVFIPDEKNGEIVMTARAGSFAGLFPKKHRLKPGQGMVGWVCLHHQALLANDVRVEPRFVNPYPDRIPTLSELTVPILLAGRLIGVLDLQSPLLDAFDENDARVVETVANQLALANENARLYQEARLRLVEQERAEHLMRLQRNILAGISSAEEFHTILESILQELTQIEGIDCGSIYLVTEEHALDMVASIGLTPAFTAAVSYLPPESQKAVFVSAGKTGYLRYSDLPLDPRISTNVRSKENILSMAVLPIVYQSQIIADLTLGSHTLTNIPLESRIVLEAVAAQLGATIARMKTEKALAASESRSQAVLEAIPDLMFLVDSNGRFLEYKSKSSMGFYRPPEEFLGKSLNEIFPPELAAQSMLAIHEALATRELRSFEYELYSQREGQLRNFEARISAAEEDLAVIIIRDISERKKAEDEIQNRERMYAALFEYNHDGVFILSPEGAIREVNRAADQMLGYSSQDLIGTPYLDLIAPEMLATCQRILRNLVAGKILPVFELAIKKKNGEYLYTEVNAAMIFDHSGAPLHIQAIVRDISQRKIVEAAQQRIFELEKTLSQIMGKYLASQDLEPFINFLLEKSGVSLGISQAILVHFNEEDQMVTNQAAWTHPDLPAQWAPWPKADTRLFEDWRTTILANEILVVPDLRATPYHEVLKETGIQSALVVPVYVKNSFFGALSFIETRQIHAWLPQETSFARNLAEILGRVIERHDEN